MTASPVLPMGARIRVLVTQLQFLWFCGHVALVLFALSHFLSGSFSAYYKALVGALVSYAIVIYKTLGKPSFDAQFLRKMTTDANLQYLALALFFYLNQYPLSGILVTYIAFSAFHILSYAKDIMIPALYPANVTQPPYIAGIVQKIKSLTVTFQPRALTAVAYWEILFVMPQIIFQVFMGRQSFFAPFLFAQFLKIRFNLSMTYKTAFAQLRQNIDSKIMPYQTQSGPLGLVCKTWIKVRDLLIKYGPMETSRPSTRPRSE